MVLAIWVFGTKTIKTHIFIKVKNSYDTSLLGHFKPLILLNSVNVPIGFTLLRLKTKNNP